MNNDKIKLFKLLKEQVLKNNRIDKLTSIKEDLECAFYENEKNIKFDKFVKIMLILFALTTTILNFVFMPILCVNNAPLLPILLILNELGIIAFSICEGGMLITCSSKKENLKLKKSIKKYNQIITLEKEKLKDIELEINKLKDKVFVLDTVQSYQKTNNIQNNIDVKINDKKERKKPERKKQKQKALKLEKKYYNKSIQK